MTNKEFLDRQFALSVQAGTSQRYHQARADLWWKCDLAAKVATAVFAVAGAILAVLSVQADASQWIVGLSVGVSVATAVSAVVLNVVPFGTWEQVHLELYRQ